MKNQLISSMTSFVLGTGVTLASLLTWTGTTDLESIKNLFDSYNQDVETDMEEVVSHYSVTVDQANAEIKDYQDALKQANDNISQLITAYNQAEQEHQQDLADMEEFYLLELGDLESELARMQTRLDSQYESDMNAIIEQANAEINQANQEVAETNEYINNEIVNSDTYNKSGNDRIAETGKVLDTTGSKEVTDISSVVPSEQPQE